MLSFLDLLKAFRCINIKINISLQKLAFEQFFPTPLRFYSQDNAKNGKNGSYKVGKNKNINFINKIFDLIMPLGTDTKNNLNKDRFMVQTSWLFRSFLSKTV